MKRFLVVQTAFAGDLILATPVAAEVRRLYPDASVDMLCIPASAQLIDNHPDVSRVLPYDKRGAGGFWKMARLLSSARYDVVLCPHRSMRSAVLAAITGAPIRVSFDRSAGAPLFTERVRYAGERHEVERNLSLLSAIAGGVDLKRAPRLYPSVADREAAAAVAGNHDGAPCVCIAPGSVWATKRWTAVGFAELAADLGRDYRVVLIGGAADRVLCEEVRIRSGAASCVNAAGRLSLTASAALIGMSALLVSNDSAPVHMASAMGTPVIAIFGATTPELGFAPFGVPGGVVQLEDLDCRPCGAHGGRRCPIGTFECMRELASTSVISAARKVLSDRKPPRVAGATR